MSLSLVSAVGGSALPFTVGQPFAQGSIPSGSSVLANIPEFQAVVKNRWPDGSVKFAILSGRADLGTGTWKTIGLSAGAAPSPQTPLSTSDLKSTGATASIQYGSFGTASWSAGDWDLPTQALVSGPQMSSWTYRKQIGSDPHLVAWLEVRAYKGGRVEVLPWIENGYLRVQAPTSKSGTATFSLGGTQRFSRSLTLANHQRAVLSTGTTLTHWIGGDAQVTPSHNAAYLMGTKLVPNYRGVSSSTSSIYSRLPTSYTPLSLGSYTNGMGSTGYHPDIGLLPEWDVAYLTTQGDPRAWRGLFIQALLAGQFGIHYRDETTNRPLRFSSYPNLVMSGGSSVSAIGASTTNSYTPTPSGTPPAQEYDSPHHPSMGYMAYLTTGWNYFLEELQFLATANFLKNTDSVRKYTEGVIETTAGANTTRGAAWALRSLAQAAAVTPDADPLRTEFVNSINSNISYYHGRYIAQPSNPLGLAEPYGSYTTGAPTTNASWMEDFLTSAFGYLKDLQVGGSTERTKLDAFLTWKYQSVVGRLGGSSTDKGVAYPYAAQYTLNYAPQAYENTNWKTGAGPWYANWAAVATSMGLPTSATAGAPLVSGHPEDCTSYWGNLMPALAYAVDHGAPGAQAAYNRVTSASNFPQMSAGFNDNPVWGVKPR